MNYLKDDNYYNNLYDLFTIKDCLDITRLYNQKLPVENNNLKNGVKEIWKNVFIDLRLYYKKGERYQNKAKTINEWKSKDTYLQDLENNTPPPRLPVCMNCNGSLKIIDKIIIDSLDQQPKVLFMSECESCRKRSSIFADGTSRVEKPQFCPKCSSVITTRYKRVKQVITTTSLCKNCGYKDSETLDLKADSDKYAQKQKDDRDLLEKYRSIYCLNDKEGQQYIRDDIQIKTSIKFLSEKTEKEADPAYQQAQKLKKLSVVEIEKLINKSLEKTSFIKLSLDKPEIDKYVIVPFNVQENNPDRSPQESKEQLQKLLKEDLKTTNWRLMSEGVTYRSGYLTGHLKAYETEDDLIKLVSLKKK
jgi:hypothetical protein